MQLHVAAMSGSHERIFPRPEGPHMLLRVRS